MNEFSLLYQVKSILEKEELSRKMTGKSFNVFDVLGMRNDEVKITSFIYEFISPQGSHGKKDLYLKLFLKYVLKISMEEEELRTCRVQREYVLDSNRRIDLVISTQNRLIPIEVKIQAVDQPKQCYDYYQVAKNSCVFYLTLFGKQPSFESAEGLTFNGDGYQKIETISFANEICYWLECCLNESQTKETAPIREVLLQFMSMIRKLTNQVEDTEMKEVKQLLLNSSENMKSALVIEQALHEEKKELLYHLFQAIENRVDAQKLVNEYDYEDHDKIEGYYKHKYVKNEDLLGISYLYKKDVKKNVDIWVRVEIN